MRGRWPFSKIFSTKKSLRRRKLLGTMKKYLHRARPDGGGRCCSGWLLALWQFRSCPVFGSGFVARQASSKFRHCMEGGACCPPMMHRTTSCDWSRAQALAATLRLLLPLLKELLEPAIIIINANNGRYLSRFIAGLKIFKIWSLLRPWPKLAR